MPKATLCTVALLTGMALLSLASPAAAQQWGAGAAVASPVVVPPRVEASADPRRSMHSGPQMVRPSGEPVLTPGHIAYLRALLKLSAAQQPYWQPVEVALSELARLQARGATVATTTMQIRRIKAIAMPLIQSLDDNQKRDAIAFGRNMGFQQLVAAF
jgi:hypothetical protein